MMSSWLKQDVKTYSCQKSTACNKSVIFFQKLATCNKLLMEMGDVS
jgi:hypothetical protein